MASKRNFKYILILKLSSVTGTCLWLSWEVNIVHIYVIYKWFSCFKPHLAGTPGWFKQKQQFAHCSHFTPAEPEKKILCMCVSVCGCEHILAVDCVCRKTCPHVHVLYAYRVSTCTSVHVLCVSSVCACVSITAPSPRASPGSWQLDNSFLLFQSRAPERTNMIINHYSNRKVRHSAQDSKRAW